ncbi:energy-coupling factor ABC transporter ATP-binding protein [Rhizobium helianthi]|uniref:Energy-coupling factor ABC transporter ATP-binding protein n=1 Tax=Rhizobium helianthi TaxID=1132695 RepID=A0ABW4M8T8_9HYPH
MRIIFENASLSFGSPSSRQVALHPLSLELAENRVGVIGLNGSGKTSFARLINGLARPSGGRVTLDGLDTVEDEAAVRAATGFIFQNPGHQIILPIIRDDIALGLKSRGLTGQAVQERVDAILGRFALEGLADRRPHELSGGQLQLAALAAVMVTEPKLLIFDEPTNQLDLRNRALVKRTLASLQEQAIVISHDLELLADFPRVLLFHEGRLAFDGSAADAIARYHEIAEC